LKSLFSENEAWLLELPDMDSRDFFQKAYLLESKKLISFTLFSTFRRTNIFFKNRFIFKYFTGQIEP
jgi:hypothetical protein